MGTGMHGVAAPSQLDVWQSVCPDPNLILRVPWLAPGAVEPSREQVLARRSASLTAALSLAYAEPLEIVRGEGAHLFDPDGTAYLDLVNNVCHVGHCHPRVVAAIAGQAARLNTNTRYLHPLIGEYARRLTALLPDPLSVVFFVNSGSEANDLALRLARAHTGRGDLLVLDAAYHGNLGSLIDASPYKFDRPGGLGAPPHVHVCELDDPYRGRFGADGAAYADDVAARIADLTAAGRAPAALIAESLPGCAGQIELAPGYLEAAFAHVRAAGGICIADEVQTGFGRMGTHFWGFQTQGVVPDVVTLGKPIGNGHPLGVVVTTPCVARSFVTGMEYFNTYGGNPVSCAAGLAVLDVIRDERLMARAERVGGRLRAGLERLAERHALIGDVRGRGLYLGVDLVRDRLNREHAPAEAAAVKEAMVRRGILISTDGPLDNVLKLKPPLALGEADVDAALAALDESLNEVAAGA
jgi:4-aminobutyrate aminotransferase-like enzyme